MTLLYNIRGTSNTQAMLSICKGFNIFGIYSSEVIFWMFEIVHLMELTWHDFFVKVCLCSWTYLLLQIGYWWHWRYIEGFYFWLNSSCTVMFRWREQTLHLLSVWRRRADGAGSTDPLLYDSFINFESAVLYFQDRSGRCSLIKLIPYTDVRVWECG